MPVDTNQSTQSSPSQPPAVQTTETAQTNTFPAQAKPVPKWKHYLNLTTYYGTIIWENLVIFGLSLQSAHGLFTSIMFIIDDYPILEQQFSQKAINTTEVTQIITEAIGLMLGTIINILFAIRLSKSQERLSHIFELILGTILIIWYGHVVEYLQQLDYTLIASLLADLNLDRLLPL